MKKDQGKTGKRGYVLIILLVFCGVLVILLGAAASYILSQSKASIVMVRQQQILEIAEAGVNYYRWHLAHVPDDYTDGTGEPGPYIHDYEDLDGNVIGQFSLNILPPEGGSTIVTIESSGYLISKPEITRTIILKMGVPWFSNYAIIADDELYFNEDTEIWGPVHSNDGIRFDGIAHNLVTSSMYKYIDHSQLPMGPPEYGVHTHKPPRDPLPPEPLPSRPDVFLAGRNFPVPPVDFEGITADLATLKNAAIANGIYLTQSDKQGYHLHFSPDHTIDITKVTSQLYCQWLFQNHWMSYSNIHSINQEESFIYKGGSSLSIPMPVNGIIFIQDDIWVDGQINGDRVTVISAKDPLASKKGSIYINNDLKYTNYDSSDVIGLIAQHDVSVGFYSEDDLKIDASIIAQDGTVKRVYYPDRSGFQQNPPNCADYAYRNQITTYGSVATKHSYEFYYPDGTGYQYQYLNYDPNLTYAPPPSFPTTGEYNIISWEER